VGVAPDVFLICCVSQPPGKQHEMGAATALSLDFASCCCGAEYPVWHGAEVCPNPREFLVEFPALNQHPPLQQRSSRLKERRTT
jgi:hypothetical protein